MAPENAVKSTQAEFDIIQNRIALALAKRESLVKSWNTSSRVQEPTKTEEELDAEDALHFRREPPNLGVGAPIPSHFFVSEAQQNSKSLRAKFFPMKGLMASKARDAEEKAASAKRAKRGDSSDEDEGRSALGKAKKQKTSKPIAAAVEDASENKTTTPHDKHGEQASPTTREDGDTSRTQHKVQHGQETDISMAATQPAIMSPCDELPSKAHLSTAADISAEDEPDTKDAEASGALEGGSETMTAQLRKVTTNLNILSAVLDPTEAKKVKDRQRKKRKRDKKKQKDALLKAVKD